VLTLIDGLTAPPKLERCRLAVTLPISYGPCHRPRCYAVGAFLPGMDCSCQLRIELLGRGIASAPSLQVGRRLGVWGWGSGWPVPGRGTRRSLLGELRAGHCRSPLASISPWRVRPNAESSGC